MGSQTRTSDFDYELPEELIAQQPAKRRDMARLMLIDRQRQRITHRRVADLPDLLAADDLLVINDTKVVPARIHGKKKTGGKIELLFIEEVEPDVWEVLMKASRRPRPGQEFEIGEGLAKAKMIRDGAMGHALIEVSSAKPVLEILRAAGSPPLPPYIKRTDADKEKERLDSERYQTVYAQKPGAVAAPTAGLHFTPRLFERLESKGVARTSITLHVGPGTFRPVSSDYVEEHRMDAERYELSPEAAAEINNRQGRCLAVGSTSVRTLETVADHEGRVQAAQGRSGIFIYPPYEFKLVEAMLTNFHLPRSTLLMMVCAFGGRDLIMRAYAEAVAEKYRFYSYGDCMLIL